MPAPSLAELQIAADPAAWRACGFTVGDDGVAVVGGIALRLTPPDDGAPTGITGWTLDGIPPDADLDGLRSRPRGGSGSDPFPPREHPNGALAVDHVVVLTPDLDRTVGAFGAAGLQPRRVREAGGGTRQAFYVLGGALAEVVGPAAGADPADPARFWGVTLAVADLDAAVALLGDRTGPAKDAVQGGRRIATVRREAALGLPVALMSPRT